MHGSPLTVIEPSVIERGNRLRVAAYARVSSDSADQLHSYLAQIDYFTALIQRNPRWELAGIYADEGITGVRSDTRAEFQQMLHDCRLGKIDHILVKSISRFSRNHLETARCLKELHSLGVSVFFEDIDTNTAHGMGDLLPAVYSLFAEQESRAISENVKKGIQMRINRGTYLPASLPYGYVRSNGVACIDEEKADIVRRIFRCYLEGMGSRAIATLLNQDGIPSRSLGSWTAASVRYLLTNPFYTGDSLWQKTWTEDDLPFRKHANKGEFPQYEVRNTHPPIISHDAFHRVQALRSARKKQYGGTGVSRKRHPFAGRIVCGCGALCRQKTHNQITYWVCRKHDGGGDCMAAQIPQAVLEDAFLCLYNKLSRHQGEILLPMHRQMLRLKKQARDYDHTAIECDRELAMLLKENHILQMQYRNIQDPASLIQREDILEQRIRLVHRRKRQALLHSHSPVHDTIRQTERIMDALRSGPSQITCFEPALVEDLVTQISVSDGKAVFRLSNGLELSEALRMEVAR